MRALLDLSIRTKLLALLVGVVSLALAIDFGVSTIGDFRRIKSAMAEQHSILADVVGANSTLALSFNDPAGAEEVLSSLTLDPAVLVACTFDAKGKVFAAYRAQGGPEFSVPPVRPDGTYFSTDSKLEVFRKITKEQQTLGTVYLCVSMDRLNVRIRENTATAANVLVGALTTALLLGWRVQSLITQPIFHLAQVAEAISTKSDYTLRATKQTSDELGGLCDGFNAMLTQIQQRDTELEHHRLHLEDLVQERTRTLEWTTQELLTSNTALQAEIVQRAAIEQQLRTTATELAHSNGELEQFNQLMVDREQRVIELKGQINELAQALGRPAPYDLSFAAAEPEGNGP